MRADMDKVVFESRRELSVLQAMAEEWLAKHKGDTTERDMVQEFADCMESLWYNW